MLKMPTSCSCYYFISEYWIRTCIQRHCAGKMLEFVLKLCFGTTKGQICIQIHSEAKPLNANNVSRKELYFSKFVPRFLEKKNAIGEALYMYLIGIS